VRLAGDLNGNWDAARISQLLSNLLQNAIQHGAKDRPVTLSANGEEGHATLRVHNEGKAIPESTLARIFEPLVWTEESTEEPSSSSGLGLGLYIASAIAEAHGGTISVDSSEKAGTTFTVRLPRSNN
jgi:signal transduction histidine kinase